MAEQTFGDMLSALIQTHKGLHTDPDRKWLIQEVIRDRDALATASGALTVWCSPESTGRSPQDTYIVKHGASLDNVDWKSPNSNPMDPQTFDELFSEALGELSSAPKIYRSRRQLGARDAWALEFHTISDRPLPVLFGYNMFRPLEMGVRTPGSFSEQPFILLALPKKKLDTKRYEGRLRVDPATKKTSTMAIAMDFERRLGVICGSAYCGTVKKLAFTVMNMLLPSQGVLPLHCAANEGPKGDCALFLGLSGTGKTTLSTVPGRKLLGDDEHGWDDAGVVNMEYGCYAKLIDLNPAKEPEIFKACFHEAIAEDHGAIVENAMYYPDGTFDLSDQRYTPNSRGSYPLSFLENVKEPPISGHPTCIFFLTADANGVLPPLAVLDPAQAMFWFMMGYTSKLAGTETGVVEPQSTFSRFFGGPFMPGLPSVYSGMLGKKLSQHGARVFLINTGWSGGSFGIGKRIDIPVTRAMIAAALDGAISAEACRFDPVFKLNVPLSCPGIADQRILNPRETWADAAAFDARASKLAAEFARQYKKILPAGDPAMDRCCPGL